MSKRNQRGEMARMVQLLEQIGPNINKIARLSGQYKESVRYRYREKILKRGFGLQARVNHESLGLKRIILVADLNSKYRTKTREFFTVLNETCYVNSYARTVPDGLYVVSASVPSEFVDAFEDLISELGRREILKPIQMHEFEWFRNVPMQAEFYNFDTDKWDADLSKSSKWALGAQKYAPSRKQRFDYSDLLVIKELEIDATRSLREIGAKLGFTYKKLLRHHNHLTQRRLISGYRTLWLASRYDPELDLVVKSKHRYLILDLLVDSVSKPELAGLMLGTNNVPFLWAESAGKSYFARFAIPFNYVNEVLQYLREKLEPLKGRVRYFLGDHDDVLFFTISHQLYDQSLKRWTFNPEKALDVVQRFEETAIQKAPG